MIDPKIQTAISDALNAHTVYGVFDAVPFIDKFSAAFGTDKTFLEKVADVDAIFDDEPKLEELREVFFDLLMINFFSADAKKLEEDYLDSEEWEQIEEDTLDRGTELLNLLLYLTECIDEEIDPELDDYLNEFLLVNDDEFQDEYSIYEPVITNQILMDSPLSEVRKVAETLPDDTELKDLFYPIMAFFQNPESNDEAAVADNAVFRTFDMAVYKILINYK
ncbi:hypothetical protein [Mucilaginibacter myungsuensis]|uniref:Uncharacterized protein n=1 Tax=Mucilaginibacter myungsuensis TaxID=649104 RepID=A0A929KUZ2_9SPHI|nr:hypothetical protein [Mucilaginibacter myungsuensis]MBE9660913.1 hypothetical protein [Mucilaginibacter myungsuensis]MDN3600959.1 hypothetical protein [Mucilaginibacter myungsuensis]